MCHNKIDFNCISGWASLPTAKRLRIAYVLENGIGDPGLGSLCGAASALAIRDYRLCSILFELALAYEIHPIQLYEGMLQCYLFLGFPRAIEGLKSLKAVFVSKAIDIGLPVNQPSRDFMAEGQKLCKEVYGCKYEQLVKLMESCSPELGRWMIEEGYGKVLSRAGLNPLQRELITVASLVSEGVPNQLFAHIRGAINTGATFEELLSILELLQIWVDEQSIVVARLKLDSLN